eukprot:PITA_25319
MLGNSIPVKYGDPRNPILTVEINGVDIPNVLEDLGVAINAITSETMLTLGLRNLKPTPIVLELEKDLPRPWLATVDAYIICRSGNMIIYNGENTNNLILYPPVEPSSPDKEKFKQNSIPLEGSETKSEEMRRVLTIIQALYFKNEREDDTINTFINSPRVVSSATRQFLESVMNFETHETIELGTEDEDIPLVAPCDSIPMEIELGKILNINLNLSPSKTEQLLKVLHKHKEAFPWDYTDMKGIPANLCTRHIYIKEDY